MRILFCSYLYAPSVGGIETVGRLLVREFRRAGHEVRVVTSSAGPAVEGIYRAPSVLELTRLMKWAELVFHNNISLRFARPLAVIRRPWVVAHHTWIARPDGRIAAGDKLKLRLLRGATNIAVSEAIAAALPVPAKVIPNPYDPDAFYRRPEIARDSHLVFAGRLVSDKGVDVLLAALAKIQTSSLQPGLTIIGDGPDRANLERQATELGLRTQIVFAGTVEGEALGVLLSRHRIMVVPSRWNEPFGLVALEGIACGCAVIGSSGGGLPEAIGPCGVTFPNGDAHELAIQLRQLLCSPDEEGSLSDQSRRHLAKHHPAEVAQAYLNAFDEAVLAHD